jgi:prevent-host-death family protein
MRIASLADVKSRLSAYIDQAGSEGPVVIARNGKAAAVLVVPANDEELEELTLYSSPKFLAMLRRAQEDMDAGRVMPAKEFWKKVKERSKSRAGGNGKTASSGRRRARP